MDFGFSRFLEMFEERFGRLATTALIAMIGAALVAYSIKVVVDTALELHSLAAQATWLNWVTLKDLSRPFIGWVIGAILYVIFVQGAWRFYFQPRLTRAAAKYEDMIAGHQAEIDKLKAVVTETGTKSRKNLDDAEAMLRHAEKVRDEIAQRIDEIEKKMALVDQHKRPVPDSESKSPLEPPHPVQEQLGTPEKK